MAFIKANLQWIIFGLIGATGIGLAVWGFLGGDEVMAKMEVVKSVTTAAKGVAADPVNKDRLEQKRLVVDKRKGDAEKAEDVALSVQKNNAFYETLDGAGNRVPTPRKPLVDGVLPVTVGNANAIQFRDTYKDEFAKLTVRLRAIDRPSGEDIQAEQMQMEAEKKTPVSLASETPWDIWRIFPAPERKDESGKRTRLDILRDWPASRVAYSRATSGRVYLDREAFGRHRLAASTDNPTPVDIWQAQMSLWIQQDLVTAFARVNEKRAAELTAAGREADVWVAHMPIKHILRVGLSDALGGIGSGSNIDFTPKWPSGTTVTGKLTNADMIVVPIQLALVVEEAALPGILEDFCAQGFYTPVNMMIYPIPPNPVQKDTLYGDDPVIRVTLDVEGYYFHTVYDQWIPQPLQDMLKKPWTGGVDPSGRGPGMRGGRG